MDFSITDNKLITESWLMNIDNLRILMNIYKFGDIHSKGIKHIKKNGRNLIDSQINTLLESAQKESSPIMKIFLDIEMDVGTNKELLSSKVEWYNNYVEILYQKLKSNPENLNTEIISWLSNNKIMSNSL